MIPTGRSTVGKNINGMDGKIFKLYKFRTMADEGGQDGTFLPDSERFKDFGKILRRISLNEFVK